MNGQCWRGRTSALRHPDLAQAVTDAPPCRAVGRIVARRAGAEARDGGQTLRKSADASLQSSQQMLRDTAASWALMRCTPKGKRSIGGARDEARLTRVVPRQPQQISDDPPRVSISRATPEKRVGAHS